MTAKRLKDLMERAERWPSEAQEEAIASLEAIEIELAARTGLSRQDREALERSADDVRQGRFATDEQVRSVFDRSRRR